MRKLWMSDGAKVITRAAFAWRCAHKLREHLEFPVHIVALVHSVVNTETKARCGRHQVCVAKQRTNDQLSLQRIERCLACDPCEMRFYDKLPSLGIALKGFHRYEPLMHHPITRMGSPIDSWAGSACYPRRTFYPLSDGPSIQNRRITNSYFRTCSTCLSHSQAGLCVYTLRLISQQPEPTFERLRYNWGGDRPSQTTRLIVSLHRITALG